MRRLVTLLALCLCWTCSASAWLHPGSAGGVGPTVLSFSTFASGRSVSCNGSDDITPAFADLLDYVIAHQGSVAPYVQYRVVMDAGNSCLFTHTDPRYNRAIILGGNAKDLIYDGGGTVTFTDGSAFDGSGAGAGYFLGTSLYADGLTGLPQDDLHLARVASVSAGASFVTVSTNGQETRFTPGNYAILAGVDLQDQGGTPPNPAVFEYLIVQSVDTMMHTVTFTTPIKYDYLSTWPTYGSGGLNQYEGGPATLYALDPGFDGQVEYRGITFNDYPYIFAQSRHAIFTSTVWTSNNNGNCGITPSVMVAVTITSSSSSCKMEFDKMVASAAMTGSTWGQLWFQSAEKGSTFVFNGGSALTNTIGTPYDFTCTSSSIDLLNVGAWGFGATRNLTATNCALPSITYQVSQEVETATYTVSSGVIVAADGVGAHPPPFQWCAPSIANKVMFRGAIAYEGNFSVTGLTQSGGNSRCATSLSGNAFPTLPLNSGTTLWVITDPAPNINFTGNTGSALAADLSQAGAQNAPIFTYSKRTYTCPANQGNVAGSLNINDTDFSGQIWGTPVSLTIDVSTPDTNGSPSTLIWDAVEAFGIGYVDMSGAQKNFYPRINLRTGGVRTVTPSMVTGAQMGDILNSGDTNMANVQFFGGGQSTGVAGVVDNASTCPVVTVTWQTTR